MPIVPLRAEHERAVRAFLADFERVGEDEVPAYFGDPAWTFPEVVSRLDAWSRGEQVPDGWVPCTTSFLVDGGEILGVVNLRHHLTESLLQLGGHVGYSVRPSARGRGHATRLLEAAMGQARELGIDRLLVTCDEDNPASIRVIEKCGGVLQDGIGREAGGTTLRYWIAL